MGDSGLRQRSKQPDSSPAKTEPDEFSGRDSMGLTPLATGTKTEEEARAMYFALFGKVTLVLGPGVAWATYLLTKLLPGQAALYALKFTFIHEHQLGWVFAAWIVVYLTRIYMSINANGARAPARIDRPDQHIYKVMAASGELSSAPYVLMATTGVEGRFNRAQRAAYNMDESLPLLITGLVLSGSVFGPVALALALLSAYGRVTFANLYKQSLAARGAGFMPAVIAEHLTAGLVGLIALKGIAGPFIPV